MEFFLSRSTFAEGSFTFLPKPQSTSAVATKTEASSGGTTAAQQYEGAEGVGRDHCHFVCSVLHYIRAHLILSKLSTCTWITGDFSAPLPMTAVGTRTLGSSELQSSCHTQSQYLKSHPIINSKAMKRLQTSYQRIYSIKTFWSTSLSALIDRFN